MANKTTPTYKASQNDQSGKLYLTVDGGKRCRFLTDLSYLQANTSWREDVVEMDGEWGKYYIISASYSDLDV
jgi:hypothetical protein